MVVIPKSMNVMMIDNQWNEIFVVIFAKLRGDLLRNVSFDDGMFIVATEIYQAAGKSRSTFDSFKTRTLIPRAQKLIDMGAIVSPQNEDSLSRPLTVDDLIITRRGNSKDIVQGTWIHPKLRMVITRWISEDFVDWGGDITGPQNADLGE